MATAPSALPAPLRAEISALLHLDGVLELLGWDEETYLPAGARDERGEQLAALEALRHARLTDPRLGERLDDARARLPAGSPGARELDLLARRRARALALPDALVTAFAAARSRSLAAWEEARQRRDFSLWAGPLQSLLDLSRQRALALAGAGEPYDALLGLHDEGMTRAQIGPVLADLRARLVPLVQRLARPARLPAWLEGQVYSDPAQERLCRSMLAAMGFDFARGRLDRSTHPFSLSAGFDDVRLTIRVFEADPLPAIFGALHEGGHGLYEQGYDPAHRGTLLARAPGSAIHESQSRLWENLIGRGRPFWSCWYPQLRDAFPGPLAGVDLDDFLAEVGRVTPTLVRVDADEVTYNLHILLRFHLECALFDGALQVDELPRAWDEGMRELLGLTPPDDLRGCMQDVHWAIGAFGYFPSYTVGNLYAAQLFEAFAADHPDWQDALARGELGVVLQWLRRHVHRVGHLHEAESIVQRATGRGLSAEPFLRHLERRYA